MKVILTQDVATLGKSGDMKSVADGYATNFLIPKRLAVPAAGGAYRAWQHDVASRDEASRADGRVGESGQAGDECARYIESRPKHKQMLRVDNDARGGR